MIESLQDSPRIALFGVNVLTTAHLAAAIVGYAFGDGVLVQMQLLVVDGVVPVRSIWHIIIAFMAKTLKVRLTAPDPNLVHEFRNFGEDVYRALRNECEVSIQEIDASTSEFHLRGIHKRELRTIAAKVRKIVEKYQRLPPVDVHEIQGV